MMRPLSDLLTSKAVQTASVLLGSLIAWAATHGFWVNPVGPGGVVAGWLGGSAWIVGAVLGVVTYALASSPRPRWYFPPVSLLFGVLSVLCFVSAWTGYTGWFSANPVDFELKAGWIELGCYLTAALVLVWSRRSRPFIPIVTLPIIIFTTWVVLPTASGAISYGCGYTYAEADGRLQNLVVMNRGDAEAQGPTGGSPE